ncbi:MAG: amidohydrolase family protein [Rhodospirillaceae bacterium]
MTEFLTDAEIAALDGAETVPFASPIPVHNISNGEFAPAPRTAAQRAVEARIKDLGDTLGRQQGLGRRRFLQTASGMAAAFLAMNEVYGPVFEVSRAEAATPEMANERARTLAGQFVFDGHTHFLRRDAAPGSPLRNFVGLREMTRRSGVNPDLQGEQTWDHLSFENYVKEMFLDSDTKIAMLSGAPADVPEDWFLTNDMKAAARDRLNRMAGSKRLYIQTIFTPGQPGWLEEVDRCAEQLKPDSFKGYTIGDNTNKDRSKYPWRMDDEKVTYPGYERMDKAGIRIVCVHKGLFPPSAAERWPRLEEYASVADVGKAAKDWPQFSFMVYHAGYRHTGGRGGPDEALAEFDRTGRLAWVTDLAEIPEKFGVRNVYADIGATFASMAVSHPRLAAILLGTLVKGLGADRIVWGTDSLWFGSPQWQIEALRRLEIPEDLQKKHGFAPLGPADGLVKSAIFGFNSARVYGLELRAAERATRNDRFAALRAAYLDAGPQRANLAYGYIAREG